MKKLTNETAKWQKSEIRMKSPKITQENERVRKKAKKEKL